MSSISIGSIIQETIERMVAILFLVSYFAVLDNGLIYYGCEKLAYFRLVNLCILYLLLDVLFVICKVFVNISVTSKVSTLFKNTERFLNCLFMLSGIYV